MWIIIRLAIRNLWRNRRRTLITSASVMFAAFFAISMSSIQKGTWQNTLQGMLHNYTGFIQVHNKGYWENQSIDLLLSNRPSFIDSITSLSEIDQKLERLQNFALVSTGSKTKGVLIAGIDPLEADRFSEISKQIEKGTFINPGKNEAVLGVDLAELLQLSIGDTLITISQGYRGNNAAGQFVVKGIGDFGNPHFNEQLIYIPLDKAQDFYAAPGLISTLVLTTHDINAVHSTAEKLRHMLGTDRYDIMTYQEMLPTLIEAQSLDEASGRIILYTLYILIGFGMLGTVMMMLKERQYEFGVLKAIGMKSWQLFQMIFLEILAIGLIGVLAGVVLAYPLIFYFEQNPIHLGAKYEDTYKQFNMEPLMTAVIQPDVFYNQAVIIFIMVVLISLYPFFTLRSLKPVEAMRA